MEKNNNLLNNNNKDLKTNLTSNYNENIDNNNMPESFTNSLYSPGFFRNFIGRLVKAEFLIGNTGLQDRIGILVDVGASYIVLKAIESNNLLYCDIFSIKFLTISKDNLYTPNNYNIDKNFLPNQFNSNMMF